MVKEYILCAAIYYKIDKVIAHQPKNIDKGIVICGRRHHNCIPISMYLQIKKGTQHIQGFLTNTDRFVDRTEAAKIAIAAGQTKNTKLIKDKEPCLISEDLY